MYLWVFRSDRDIDVKGLTERLLCIYFGFHLVEIQWKFKLALFVLKSVHFLHLALISQILLQNYPSQ